MNRILLTLASLAALSAFSAAQVVAGQTDTFDTDVMNWQGAQPLWIGSGGPAGSGDGYLQLISTGGSGQYSKMAGFNAQQWSGDFATAGISAISVDLRNSGSTALNMRLTFFDQSLQNRWVSNATADLAVGSGWQHFTFMIDSSLFTRVQGSNTFGDEMSAVSRMMFRHDPGAPSANGTTIAATLDIDNIHAVPVPEPASVLLVGAGCAAILRRRRNRR